MIHFANAAEFERLSEHLTCNASAARPARAAGAYGRGSLAYFS